MLDMIYEYRCNECGYRFAMSEPLGAPEGGRQCPNCESHDTRRIISGSGMSCSCKSGACNIDD